MPCVPLQMGTGIRRRRSWTRGQSENGRGAERGHRRCTTLRRSETCVGSGLGGVRTGGGHQWHFALLTLVEQWMVLECAHAA